MKWMVIKGVRYPSSVISAFAVYNMDNPFLNIADGYPVDVDWETEGFYQYNDAGTLPGNCADFIFHKLND